MTILFFLQSQIFSNNPKIVKFPISVNHFPDYPIWSALFPLSGPDEGNVTIIAHIRLHLLRFVITLACDTLRYTLKIQSAGNEQFFVNYDGQFENSDDDGYVFFCINSLNAYSNPNFEFNFFFDFFSRRILADSVSEATFSCEISKKKNKF